MTKKTLLSLIFLAIFGVLSVWAFIISQNIMGNTKIAKEDSGIDEQVTLRELIIIETKDGKKFWEVYADSGRFDKGSEKAVLNNISANFYKEEEIVLSVKSPVAVYNSEKKQITLKGGAEGANNKDIYIKADQICWTGSQDKINAKGNVKIIRNDQVMTVSDESFFDTDFTNLKISGDSNTYVYSLR